MFEKIRKALRHIFCLKCPNCKGDLVIEMFDMQFDKIVYKCNKCNEEFI